MPQATQRPQNISRDTRTRQFIQESLQEALEALPRDSASDFCSLAKMLSEEEYPVERDAIVQTMAEILLPDLTKVSVEEVSISTEDEKKIRQKVDHWYASVGGRIKSHRGQAHLTQEQLAKKAGIPQSHISRLESGKHAPSYVTIEKIAKALGLQPGDINPSCEP